MFSNLKFYNRPISVSLFLRVLHRVKKLLRRLCSDFVHIMNLLFLVLSVMNTFPGSLTLSQQRLGAISGELQRTPHYI